VIEDIASVSIDFLSTMRTEILREYLPDSIRDPSLHLLPNSKCLKLDLSLPLTPQTISIAPTINFILQIQNRL
jgi:hypothetical protein